MKLCYLLLPIYAIGFMFHPVKQLHVQKIAMSADFFVCKVLEVASKKGTETILLSRERGYYYEPVLDEDDPDYHEKVQEFYDSFYETLFSPITIYKDGEFLHEKFEDKYSKKIEKYCVTNQMTMFDIFNVTKTEYKYSN